MGMVPASVTPALKRLRQEPPKSETCLRTSKTDLPEVQHFCEAGRIRTRTGDAGDDDKGDGELSTAESLRRVQHLI